MESMYFFFLLIQYLTFARFDAYTKAAEHITIAQAILMNKAQAAVEIDRILTECISRVSPD
jgi:pyruvate decarboxylase